MTPLVNPPNWGSMDDVLNQPPLDVNAFSSWCSVVGMLLTCVLNLVMGIVGGLCSCCYVGISIGSSCCPRVSPMGSVLLGHPWYLVWTWWRYMIAELVALVVQGKSRLGLFVWEWKAFGSGSHWWHGEGIWFWKYEDVERTLKSQQVRASAFGCLQACVPDLFASGLLIFLSTGGPESQWGAIRTALHDFFQAQGDFTLYQSRALQLGVKVAAGWPGPKLSDLDDLGRVQREVSKCIFFMMFGVWLDDDDAVVLAGWRKLAGTFILPRLAQRLKLNSGIRKVKQLRAATVALVEKHGQQQIFVDINDGLGDFKRDTVVKLCDEIMYVVGFAGVGGTSACVESAGQFLQTKIPKEACRNLIDFGDYQTSEDMVRVYKANPEAYIKETCRLDPPVTSACCVLQEATTVELAGRSVSFEPGLLQQYALSMANRDEAVFERPSVFDPTRENLDMSLTWNGAFGRGVDETQYPRICPGRYLSLAIAQAILDHVVGGQ